MITVDTLTRAPQNRQLIGQAVEAVMYRYLVDEQVAFAYLTRTSQNSNVKLHDVAARIVADTATGAYRHPAHGRWPQRPAPTSRPSRHGRPRSATTARAPAYGVLTGGTGLPRCGEGRTRPGPAATSPPAPTSAPPAGLQPGQPPHVSSDSTMLKADRTARRAARNTAWQQMVRQAPAATLADGHGVQRGTAARHAKIAGADYASSADHGHHGPAAG